MRREEGVGRDGKRDMALALMPVFLLMSTTYVRGKEGYGIGTDASILKHVNNVCYGNHVSIQVLVKKGAGKGFVGRCTKTC